MLGWAGSFCLANGSWWFFNPAFLKNWRCKTSKSLKPQKKSINKSSDLKKYHPHGPQYHPARRKPYEIGTWCSSLWVRPSVSTWPAGNIQDHLSSEARPRMPVVKWRLWFGIPPSQTSMFHAGSLPWASLVWGGFCERGWQGQKVDGNFRIYASQAATKWCVSFRNGMLIQLDRLAENKLAKCGAKRWCWTIPNRHHGRLTQYVVPENPTFPWRPSKKFQDAYRFESSRQCLLVEFQTVCRWENTVKNWLSKIMANGGWFLALRSDVYTENCLQKSGKVPIFQRRVRKFHHKIHVKQNLTPYLFGVGSKFPGPTASAFPSFTVTISSNKRRVGVVVSVDGVVSVPKWLIMA